MTPNKPPPRNTSALGTSKLRRLWALPRSASTQGAQDEQRATRRTIGELGWLLLVVVLAYLAFVRRNLGIEELAATLGVILAYALFVLALQTFSAARTHSTWHTIVRCWAMIALISWMLWQAGGNWQALANLYHVVIITSALTLGGRVTALNVTLVALALVTLERFGSDLVATPAQRAYNLLLLLGPMVLVAFVTSRLAGDIRRALERIRYISETDELTRLYNLRAFVNIAERLHRQAKRYQRSYALVMIDSDSLKSVNDTHGHAAGNALLKLTTQVIRAQLRDTDVPARYGGDEFVVLLPETNAEGARELGERIRRNIADRPLLVDDKRIGTTVSVGVASFPDHGAELRNVLNKADQAMYSSKKGGRNRVTIASVG